MAINGNFTPVLAKHTKSFSLIDRVSVCVDRMQRNFEPIRCKKGTDSIRQEVEDSLRRLSVDAIDLYQVHWPPDPDFAELRSVSINLLFSPTG
jgi:aryl-alcohol dehydrogenase-like predicted oxidoreductase